MTDFAIQQALILARLLQMSGAYSEAEEVCDKIVADHPDHSDALFLLATLAMQRGQLNRAVELLNRAITIQPRNGQMLAMLGNVLASGGKYEEAVTAYSNAIGLNVVHPVIHTNLGSALKLLGRLDEAIAAHKQAIGLDPNYAEAYSNLASALESNGQFNEAIAACEKAIALKPNFAEAHFNLGIALEKSGQLAKSIVAYRDAVALKPGSAAYHSNLGNVLRNNKQLDEAIAAQEHAIAINPGFIKAHLGLGNALKDKEELDQAITAYRHAISLDANYGLAYCNLGAALVDKGDLPAAISVYRRAIDLMPDRAENHAVLADCLLTLGQFDEGWSEYEWRDRAEKDHKPRGFAQPQWDGASLKGRTILLHAEQGLGDTLQFVRYVPMVMRLGGNVILECQGELLRLLKPLAVGCELIQRGKPLPPFDVQCRLLSLPMIFGTRLESIPREIPYIQADPADIEVWRQRLSSLDKNLKVGLVWAGNPQNSNDHNRSSTLAQFALLSQIPNVNFISLQKGPSRQQLIDMQSTMKLLDLTDDLRDMADTAGLISNLDLVISIDSAVAHLAGAMGKPVWTLLCFAADWRWLMHRDDCPWYPTMRLFRQPARRNWTSVLQSVADALSKFQPLPQAD